MTTGRAEPPNTRRAPSKAVVFGFVAATIGAALFVWIVIRVRQANARKAASREPSHAIQKIEAHPHVIFRDIAPSSTDDFGMLEGSALDDEGDPLGARANSTARCMRVHFARLRDATHVGLCFESDPTPDEHGASATLRGLDASWSTTWSLAMGGIPSRLRVSPHGKIGAATVFVTGHSYDDKSMSTRTILVDMATGAELADLESFAVESAGAPLVQNDEGGLNLWGVTFESDDDTFYVTVARGAKTWLAHGSLSSRKLATVRENVECPSLSPDGKTIAFKKRTSDDRADTHLFVLEVASLREHALPGESQVIDDQAEWLDDETILYKRGANVWAADTDGLGAPRLFLDHGSSPAIIDAFR